MGILVGSAILQAGVCLHLLVAAPPSFGDRTSNLIGDTNTKLVQTPLDNQKTLDCPKLSRKGLFQPARALPAKAMAQNNIGRIKEKLKLTAILELQGKPVAYIQIIDQGLQRCEEGEEISDLFTVRRILTQSVEVEILGHRVTLNL